MEGCYVTNFYLTVRDMVSEARRFNQTDLMTARLVTPSFVASSVTIFAVVFAVTSSYYVISRLWKILYTMYDFFFLPTNMVQPLGSVGYMNHESYDLSRKQLVNLVRRRRKLGLEVPPVYPNGWFRILDGRFLKKGQVKQVTAFGENLVVFRGNSGKVSVLDAYCTHMGANLAVGGRVYGDCIECPFHAWTFDGEGKCVRIPYADKVPEYATIKSWHCRELNGSVYIWYHCDKLEPEWEIPSVPELDPGKYRYRGRIEHHINTHLQDIPENGYDEAHLQHLHLPFALSGVDLSTQIDSRFNIADNVMKTDYSKMTAYERHIARIDLMHSFKLLKKWECLYLNFEIWQIGPGIVHLYILSPLGKIIVVQNITAVGPMDQVLTHAVYTKWFIPLLFAKFALYYLRVQVDRDLMVWNNRTFLARPLLLKEEKIQKKFRRWFQQFYTENSPRLGDVVKKDLQW